MIRRYCRHGPTASAYWHSRDLNEVVEVVHHPRGQVLAEGHSSELRVLACAFEIAGSQPQSREAAEALPAQLAERIQQLSEGLAAGRLELCEAIERRKGHGLAVCQQMLHARHPVGALPMNQMSHHVVGAPRVRTFVAGLPRGRKPAKQRVQDLRRSHEHGHGGFEIEVHVNRAARLATAPRRRDVSGCGRRGCLPKSQASPSAFRPSRSRQPARTPVRP